MYRAQFPFLILFFYLYCSLAPIVQIKELFHHKLHEELQSQIDPLEVASALPYELFDGLPCNQVYLMHKQILYKTSYLVRFLVSIAFLPSSFFLTLVIKNYFPYIIDLTRSLSI